MSENPFGQWVCPRCGCEEFDDHDSGPGNYGDDRTWTSLVCKKCGLRYSGWYEKWVECDSWEYEEDAPEWRSLDKLNEEIKKLKAKPWEEWTLPDKLRYAGIRGTPADTFWAINLILDRFFEAFGTKKEQ